ncbi:TrmH family RNA methyltransferase [Litchfieldia salsa]|uniref:RNA methyltransferase, TrmH family n=1 Tax=Litchfieldia salsa TaxID=930152 RepID=A0A1H0NZS7_9BACI|nr:RNA methyltransferase [Litchfieldia salsa]SDO98109.1 RNA methyltransferase, TrmH family [Litchfieldia salsa]
MKKIESIKNPLVKEWKKLQTRKERERTQSFLIEGFHLVEEALGYPDRVTQIIISENAEMPSRWELNDITIIVVTDEIMKEICDTETTQGIAAVCKKVDSHDLNMDKPSPRFLLIDAVQDPGNLGTIIRTAEAAGIDAIFIGEGTVDIYNSKVVRSTQGAIFHLPIIKGNLHEWIRRLKERNIPVYGTALQNAVPYQEVSSKGSFALIVGNEGNGVAKDLLVETTQNLYIPIYGKSESLNVAIAAAILVYHLR